MSQRYSYVSYQVQHGKKKKRREKENRGGDEMVWYYQRRKSALKASRPFQMWHGYILSLIQSRITP